MEEAAHASTTDLAQLEKRFRRWRQTRSRGERIPESLWTAAATLARSEGVSPVARVLVLDYYRLKERAEVQESPGDVDEAPSFVELAVDPAGPDCTPEIEIVHKDGARLLIHASSGMGLAVDDLVRAFLESSH
ncbi:hypothetical protein DRQ32_07920 [bacterium]|nr:MAG: hypothetical protein DRQ32_07920 [bacterium]